MYEYWCVCVSMYNNSKSIGQDHGMLGLTSLLTTACLNRAPSFRLLRRVATWSARVDQMQY